MSETRETPPAGSLIGGKYRVIRELGAGGMGSLVEAEHPVLKKSVAIKLLRGPSSEQAHRRLIREAEAAQALHSEHVVRVFDVGFHDDAPYIVMECLEGRDLASVVADGPLDTEDAVDAVLEACVGVAEAHALGIVHRDLKPANLFSTRHANGQHAVKVLDFGISKQLELESASDDPACTSPGQMLGSPYFMSPEQLRNPAKVDARSDVWSLGVTLYNLLTSAQPFRRDAVSEVTAAIFTDEPQPITDHRSDLPDGLVQAISETLRKRADERTPSVRAFAEAIVPFASRRGRLAAERILSRSEPAREPRSLPRATSSAAEVTATDAGVSATLSRLSVSSPKEQSTAGRSQPEPRTWRAPALVLIVGSIAALVWWRAVQTPAESAQPAASDPPPSAVQSIRPAPPVRPSGATTSAAPTATTTTTSAAQTQTRAKRSAGPAPRLSAAVPSASLTPPTPTPPKLDIDGVPIVE